MSKPYALISDTHFHCWDQFSTINSDGINSRLQVILDEIKRAAEVLKEHGGDTLIHAGDWFHVRGRLEPAVLNPVLGLFEEIYRDGISVVGICGNHDLASKDSKWLTNAAHALTGVGVEMCNETNRLRDDHDFKITLIPWHHSTDSLKDEIIRLAHELGEDAAKHDLIIHAPVDGVIDGLPDHGLTDEWLAKAGFKRVFSGHYHNFKDFGNGVYSIGATTHQTWSDIDSKAGFLLVYPDKVVRHASHAPSFVEIEGDMTEEELLIIDGNYVRAKIGKATQSQVNELRAELMTRGAKGVLLQAVVDKTAAGERESVVEHSAVRLEESIGAFIKHRSFTNPAELQQHCEDILSRVEAV